jgi:hypothetical protein
MFRFTIRDVLWLTVVVALMLGWWVERTELRKVNRGLGRNLNLSRKANRELHEKLGTIPVVTTAP